MTCMVLKAIDHSGDMLYITNKQDQWGLFLFIRKVSVC